MAEDPRMLVGLCCEWVRVRTADDFQDLSHLRTILFSFGLKSLAGIRHGHRELLHSQMLEL